MNHYLIPANSKKSQLILGIFTMQDLILFGTGVLITGVLLLVLQTDDFTSQILKLLPALITGILVLPIPNYHNVLGFTNSLLTYINSRKQYYWKGWCVKDVYGRDFETKK